MTDLPRDAATDAEIEGWTLRRERPQSFTERLIARARHEQERREALERLLGQVRPAGCSMHPTVAIRGCDRCHDALLIQVGILREAGRP